MATIQARILLTAAYGVALGAALAYDNAHPGASQLPVLLLWIAAPVVGYAVGRWWAALAVIGALVGHAIGWDSGENDGNPPFWAPYAITIVASLAGPMLLGVLAARLAAKHRLGRVDQ